MNPKVASCLRIAGEISRSLGIEKPIKVLVVDDARPFCELVKQFLNHGHLKQQYSVDCALTHAEALKKVMENKHDVYLVDYVLNDGWTGMDLVKEAQHNGVDAPFVMVTGNPSIELDISALKQDFMSLAYKPELTPDSLDRAIKFSIKNYRTRQCVISGESV